ncbi:unnamed protein product, partial [Laminaria digitata]
MGKLQPQDVLRVKNGFNSDWMPGGYRDVKVNPVVNQHLCEIQLQLRDFFALKSGQHAVYTWARELNVKQEMRAENLFEKLSPEGREEMVNLARQNWQGRGLWLADLQLAAGQHNLAEKGFRQNLSEAEDVLRGFEDHGSYERRKTLLSVSTFRANLGTALQKTVRREQFDGQIWEEFAENVALQRTSLRTFLARRTRHSIPIAFPLTFQGSVKEAKPPVGLGLEILSATVGDLHSNYASTRNSRVWLYSLCSSGKYYEAGLLLERSVAFSMEALGPEHPDVATFLDNRAVLLNNQGKCEEAGPLYDRSLAIREKALGPDHPAVAIALNNRAGLLQKQGKHEEAGPLYECSIAIREKALGPGHPAVVESLNNWARLLETFLRIFRAISLNVDSVTLSTAFQGKYAEAEPLYERSQAIFEKALGSEHRHVATILNNRASLLERQGKYVEAGPLFERSLAILEKALGPDHPAMATALNNRRCFLGGPFPHTNPLLVIRGKYAEAGSLYERSQAILEKVLGPEHPDMAQSLNNQAGLLQKLGKYEETEPLNKRAIVIWEATLGSDHPDVANGLNDRALLLEKLGKYKEVEPLSKRAIVISEAALGSDHTQVATGLNNRAALLQKQGKVNEAIPLLERVFSIRERKLGADHPETVDTHNKLELAWKQVRAQET